MNFCNLGLAVIATEVEAISDLNKRIDYRFEDACKLLLACKGRVVVTGMGKSGHIGRKISATFSSTGTPSFFMHPAEAGHGDLGMITNQDTLLAISNSGQTSELVMLLPLLKRLNVPLITLTGNKQSVLAKAANINLDISVRKEACPLGLAPTTSTTAALVMGDALAITLLQVRGFSEQDFALSHPGGMLGKRLLLSIDEVWHDGQNLPLVNEHATISEALLEVSEKKLGMTCVVNKQGVLVGVYTDGDVRRSLTQQLNINSTPLAKVMSTGCKTIKKGLLAIKALDIMQEHRITALVVIDEENHPTAVVHVHDLLRAGIL